MTLITYTYAYYQNKKIPENIGEKASLSLTYCFIIIVEETVCVVEWQLECVDVKGAKQIRGNLRETTRKKVYCTMMKSNKTN